MMKEFIDQYVSNSQDDCIKSQEDYISGRHKALENKFRSLLKYKNDSRKLLKEINWKEENIT